MAGAIYGKGDSISVVKYTANNNSNNDDNNLL